MSNFVSRQAARRHSTRGSFKIVPKRKPKSVAYLQIGVKAVKMNLDCHCVKTYDSSTGNHHCLCNFDRLPVAERKRANKRRVAICLGTTGFVQGKVAIFSVILMGASINRQLMSAGKPIPAWSAILGEGVPVLGVMHTTPLFKVEHGSGVHDTIYTPAAMPLGIHLMPRPSTQPSLPSPISRPCTLCQPSGMSQIPASRFHQSTQMQWQVYTCVLSAGTCNMLSTQVVNSDAGTSHLQQPALGYT